jgi:hypothetical protein
MWASVGGHTDVVQILVEGCADTEAKSNVRDGD